MPSPAQAAGQLARQAPERGVVDRASRRMYRDSLRCLAGVAFDPGGKRFVAPPTGGAKPYLVGAMRRSVHEHDGARLLALRARPSNRSSTRSRHDRSGSSGSSSSKTLTIRAHWKTLKRM